MLIFLGRGSAFNVTEKNTSAYFIDLPSLFLFDCGQSVFESIIKKNILNNIENVYIFITHLHADHVGSLSTLLYYCKKIQINTKIFFDDKEKLIEFLKIQGNSIDNIYNLPQEIQGFKFESYKTTHAKGINAFSYKIINKLSNNYIFYSGDTNELKNLYELINDDKCSEIYLDCAYEKNEAHINIDDLINLIKNLDNKDNISKINLMHLDNVNQIKNLKIKIVCIGE